MSVQRANDRLYAFLLTEAMTSRSANSGFLGRRNKLPRFVLPSSRFFSFHKSVKIEIPLHSVEDKYHLLGRLEQCTAGA